MRHPPDPEDKWDRKDLKELKADPWMLELLHLNPWYCSWGPYEDYMCNKEAGWQSPVFFGSWEEFRLAKWKLDSLNELVNFYFEVKRPTRKCSACKATGLNPDTRRIAKDFYDFDRRGTRWCEQITQDEVEALLAENRLAAFYPSHEAWVAAVRGEGPRPEVTAEQVNRSGKKHLCHDAINRHILIETRARRLGVYGVCSECEGDGRIFTGPAQVNLVLWMIHPRKGCSRGVEIQHVEQKDLPAIFRLLARGAKRNAKRFRQVVAAGNTYTAEPLQGGCVCW